MKKKSAAMTMVVSKIKDTCEQLDDVRTIGIQDHENPTPYDLTLIEGMAGHFLTSEDICDILRMPKSRFNQNLEYQEAYQRGQGMGRASLKRMQMVAAKTNPVMLIWLGKQHLGQEDKVTAPQGESQLDAYTGFLNKLNIIVNVSTTGNSSPTIIGAGKGDSETLLENVGENGTTATITGGVVGSAEDAQVDRRMEPTREKPRKSFHGLVEDMVVSRGAGVG